MYIGPYIQQNDQPVYYHWKPHHAISTADLPPPNPTARSSYLGDIVPEATLAPHCDWCSAGERVVGVPLRGTEGASSRDDMVSEGALLTGWNAGLADQKKTLPLMRRFYFFTAWIFP